MTAAGPRVPRTLLPVCSAALVVAAAWAAWPLHSAPFTAPGLEAAPASAEPRAIAALDLDAFRAPIWVAPPTPPPAPTAPVTQAPPPLKLQLLAIIRDDAGYKAAVYDPDHDRLFVVTSGDQVGAHTVDEVRADHVRFREGTLALREGDQP